MLVYVLLFQTPNIAFIIVVNDSYASKYSQTKPGIKISTKTPPTTPKEAK